METIQPSPTTSTLGIPTHCPQDGQEVIEAMTALLETDKSKDVRIAVVQSLPLSTATLPVLLQRTSDVNPLVSSKETGPA